MDKFYYHKNPASDLRLEFDLDDLATISDCVKKITGVGNFQFPTIATINGEPVMRKDWDSIVDGELVFITVVAGGSANQEQKNTMIGVGSIVIGAVLVITGYGAVFGYGLIASGIITLGTQALMPDPEEPVVAKKNSLKNSPTYQQGARNTTRPNEAIPSRYGRMLCVPDLAHRLWTYWVDVDENTSRKMIRTVLVLGWGSYDIHEVRLGTQNIRQLADVTRQDIAPGAGVPTGINHEVSTEANIKVQSSAFANENMDIAFRWLPVAGSWIKGPWAASTQYSPGDLVDCPDPAQGDKMICTSSNLSSSDWLDNRGQWMPIPAGLVWLSATEYTLLYAGSPVGELSDNINLNNGLGDIIPIPKVVFPDESDNTAVLPRYVWWRYQSVDNTAVAGGNTDLILCSNDEAWRSPDYGLLTTTLPFASRYVVGLTDEPDDNTDYGALTLNRRWASIEKGFVDVEFPRGLYANAGNGNVSDAGVAHYIYIKRSKTAWYESEWVLAGLKLISRKNTKPVGWTFEIDYNDHGGISNIKQEYMIVRIDPVWDEMADGINDSVWSGFRLQCEDTQFTGGIDKSLQTTRVVVDIPALSSTQSLVDKISVDCTRHLRHWNGTTWDSPTPTREIMDAVADILSDANYGCGLSDSQYDLETLYNLHSSEWNPRGWKFDGQYEQGQSRWESISALLQSCLSRPILLNGIPSFYMDTSTSVRSIMFSEKNIIEGSFVYEITPPAVDDSDGVSVSYTAENSYAATDYKVDHEGNNDPSDPVAISLFGVTVPSQAQALARYSANQAMWRREKISFETGLEGYLPVFGQLVPVQHSMPEWGDVGEVIAVHGSYWQIDRKIDWSGGQHYAIIRQPNGSTDQTTYQIQRSATLPIGVAVSDWDSIIEFTSGTPSTPEYDRSMERTHMAIGLSSEVVSDILVTNISPASASTVSISGVIYDTRVYTGV